MGHLVRIGGTAGQALPADFVHSPDAPAHTDVPVEEPVEPDLDAMTKDQLYALAKDAEVEGRSDMTRDELIDALRD